MDEIISTANRALAAFFATWVNPAAFVLMLGAAARLWWNDRDRERSWQQARSDAYAEGFKEGVSAARQRDASQP